MRNTMDDCKAPNEESSGAALVRRCQAQALNQGSEGNAGTFWGLGPRQMHEHALNFWALGYPKITGSQTTSRLGRLQ